MAKTVHLRSNSGGRFQPALDAKFADLSISAVPDQVTTSEVVQAANVTSIAHRAEEHVTVAFSQLGSGRIINRYTRQS